MDFADGAEIYVDVDEPRGCACARRIALSDLAHLLLNVTEGELLTIPNRDLDAAGHVHVVAVHHVED